VSSSFGVELGFVRDFRTDVILKLSRNQLQAEIEAENLPERTDGIREGADFGRVQ
jgi:hypothetical protein